MKSLIRLAATALAAAVLIPGVAIAQDTSAAQLPSKSADLAQTLVGQLTTRGIQAIAVRDPHDPTRYIAALYVPGGELLVVAAQYPVPALLDKRLQKGEYQEVYVDLQSLASPGKRVFVEDLQANGLHSACGPDQPFDIVSENGGETKFNGDFATQKLTAEQYQSRFATADASYADMLTALSGQLKGSAVKTAR